MGRMVAVVTGASSGIGMVFARRLARTHDLVLVARRRERLEELAAELMREFGCGVEVLVADLSDDGKTAEVAQRIGAMPELGLLVNNAGFGTKGYFWQTDLKKEMEMHALHVMATVALTHAALQNMVAHGRGSVVNVCSVASFVRRPGGASYSATKSWMAMFTEALYLDLKVAQVPVTVQALCPGFTYSEFHDVMTVDGGKVDRAKVIRGSMWLKAERVVDESLAGLKKGTLFVIPDWRYRGIVSLFSMVPRWLRLRMEGMVGRR